MQNKTRIIPFLNITIPFIYLGLICLTGCGKVEDKETDDNTGPVNLGLFKVDANPAKGFYWPYYLNVPNSSRSSILLVIPNNTGTVNDNQSVHDEAARLTAEWGGDYGRELGLPVLVPTFPRSNQIGIDVYTHALDRKTLELTATELRRIDLQLIAMVDDATERLASKGIALNAKIFMLGFSASGSFTNRFTALHPDKVRAAAIGSPGGWPIAPVESWQGKTLPYPAGTSGVLQLTGSSFNLGLFTKVPLFFFMGDQDTNDAVPLNDTIIRPLFGATPVARWPLAKGIYESVSYSGKFNLYPGIGHELRNVMKVDIVDFFIINKSTK